LYSLADTARILQIPPGRLRYWERTELVRASACLDDQPAFDFQDLVSLRSLLELMEEGVSLRRIRRSVDDLRDRVPDIQRPLGALRIGPRGVGCIFVHHEGALLEPSGQLVLDFADRDAELQVAELKPGTGAQGRTALEWFEAGCQADGRPETADEAIQAYRYALELDPGFADAHCNLGTVFFNRGDRPTARGYYEAALHVEPAHLEANFNLGNLLEEDGRREAALHHYKLAARTDPLFPDAQLNLALLFEKLELPRRAREHWRRYVQLVPEGSWSEIARKRLRGPG